MTSLRYVQSGHRAREAQRAAKRVSAPAKVRIAAVAAAVILPAALAVVAGAAFPRTHRAPAPVVALNVPVPVPVPAPAPKPAPATLKLTRTIDKLHADEALSSAVAREGVAADDTSALMRALKGHLDVRGLRAGLSFTLEQRPDTGLQSFELRTLSNDGVPRTVRAVRQVKPITVDAPDAIFAVSVVDAPIESKVEGVSGSVQSSLYQSMLDAGEDMNLVNKFVDVFAWNVDFYKQTQTGDEFRVVVEKKYAGGRFLGYGKVLAAEYVNAGAVYRGFLFDSKDGKQSGTYDDEGNALQRAFLKAPMEITRVTSSYGMRFHPLSKGEQFHHGIDYGAPLGTPIWSVADGTVEMAKLNGGAGNMVRIKHLNGFETEYFHMSRFADGMKAGARVKQKQIIGYVGSTGMSTGPHLHFGMFKNGDHVDPAKEKTGTAAPVPKPYADEFHKFAAPLLEKLKGLSRV